jgi:hypothetical protein
MNAFPQKPSMLQYVIQTLDLDRLLGMTFAVQALIEIVMNLPVSYGTRYIKISFFAVIFSRTLLQGVVAVVTVLGIVATIPCTMFCFLISYLQM